MLQTPVTIPAASSERLISSPVSTLQAAAVGSSSMSERLIAPSPASVFTPVAASSSMSEQAPLPSSAASAGHPAELARASTAAQQPQTTRILEQATAPTRQQVLLWQQVTRRFVDHQRFLPLGVTSTKHLGTDYEYVLETFQVAYHTGLRCLIITAWSNGGNPTNPGHHFANMEAFPLLIEEMLLGRMPSMAPYLVRTATGSGRGRTTVSSKLQATTATYWANVLFFSAVDRAWVLHLLLQIYTDCYGPFLQANPGYGHQRRHADIAFAARIIAAVQQLNFVAV